MAGMTDWGPSPVLGPSCLDPPSAEGPGWRTGDPDI